MMRNRLFRKVDFAISETENVSTTVKKKQGIFGVSLPCQWKYWHRVKNRLRDKTGFGMYRMIGISPEVSF